MMMLDRKSPLAITIEGIRENSNEILYQNVSEIQKNIRANTTTKSTDPCSGSV